MYKATQTRIQTYLNDVAGVRIVCAFIDDNRLDEQIRQAVFYQVDGSHKAEGNGLGLALVKRIVDSAGGTIKAENREYGGCRFVIELPKQKDEII